MNFCLSSAVASRLISLGAALRDTLTVDCLIPDTLIIFVTYLLTSAAVFLCCLHDRDHRSSHRVFCWQYSVHRRSVVVCCGDIMHNYEYNHIQFRQATPTDTLGHVFVALMCAVRSAATFYF